MEEKTAVIEAPVARRPRARARSGGAGSDRGGAHDAKRIRARWLWAAVVGAVIVGVAVVLAVLLTARAQTAAGPELAGAAVGTDAAFAELSQTIDAATALAAETTLDQLADPPALTQLLGALAEARLALGGTVTEAEASRAALADAMDRVQRSKSAKALADARTELSAIIGTAIEVNDAAEGHVADDAVRVELQSRIDAGRALLASSTASAQEVTAQSQAITDQTAAVLAARLLGFRAADGTWCRDGLGAPSCLTIDWPVATLPGGQAVELAGGEQALQGSGCFETDEFGQGRDKARLLYCPAGEAPPDSRKVPPLEAGDPSRERLWWSADGRLSDLRYRT